MEERKCFVCGDFGHIAHHCRNMGEKRSVYMPSNRFEVLRNRVMQREESRNKVEKDMKMIFITNKILTGCDTGAE